MVELSRDDIAFFKDQGYLIKREVLNPELMERARCRLWEGAPEGRVRENPDTWVGPSNLKKKTKKILTEEKDFAGTTENPVVKTGCQIASY